MMMVVVISSNDDVAAIPVNNSPFYGGSCALRLEVAVEGVVEVGDWLIVVNCAASC